jgi:uncharacterized membrane-anchored protein YjiN (DUF445 family)
VPVAETGLERSPAQALARARRLATGVLLALAAVFVATHLVGAETGAVALIRSMAEAGMVGGLADWFAVEALFRRPLGLPIPHTALLQANQQKAAKNLGRFFQTHFLDPAELDARLRRMQPSAHAAAWLARPENAAAIAGRLVSLLGTLLREEPPRRVQVRLRAWLRAQAAHSGADAAIAEAVAALVKAGIRSTVVDELLDLVRRAVHENRAAAVTLVHDRSRWWIAKPVDRRVANLAVDGVLSLLDELKSADSPLRRDLETALDRMIDGLATQGVLERAVAEARQQLQRNGTFDRLALRRAETVRSRLAARLDTEPAAVADPLAEALGTFAARLRADPAARDALDGRIAAGTARLVGDLRPVLGGYVADVVAGWEPDALIARFEEQIGPDLQFIRINGALLGALIGGALHLAGLALD